MWDLTIVHIVIRVLKEGVSGIELRVTSCNQGVMSY